MTGVQYHPTAPNLFVTGDTRGEVVLRDMRLAFGEGSRNHQGVVQTVSNSYRVLDALVYLID